MATQRQCEFFVLRYVPDVVKGEFVNVGILMLESDAGFSDVRLTRDWRRVRCLDPGVDLEMLEAVGRDLRARLLVVEDRDALVRTLEHSLSGVLQLSPPSGCVTDDPRKEIEEIASMYLETKRAGEKRETTGRQRIYGQMRAAFEKAGVWPHMRQGIAAEQYTHKGDPLKIDCGYRPNGEIKLFQSLSVVSDVNAAKVLAFSYPQIAAGIYRQENTSTHLTVVVEANVDPEDDSVAFVFNVLEQSKIQVVGIDQMEQFAEVARKELRL